MDTHYTAMVIWRMGEEGPEYLVLEYDSGTGVQIKFPGGTSNDHPGETVIETLHREVRDETGLVLPVTPKKFWELTCPSSPGRGIHTKYAFIIHFGQCAGKLRTEPMVDQGGDKLSPPFWRTADELANPDPAIGLYHTHRPILMAAMRIVGR